MVWDIIERHQERKGVATTWLGQRRRRWNKNIVIRADKGSLVVVIDREQYRREVPQAAKQ